MGVGTYSFKETFAFYKQMLIIKKLGASINSNLIAIGRFQWDAFEHLASKVTSNCFLQGVIMGVLFNTHFIFYMLLTILFG